MIVLPFKANAMSLLLCLGSLYGERVRVCIPREGQGHSFKAPLAGERGRIWMGAEEDSDGQRNFGSVPPSTGGGAAAGRRARKRSGAFVNCGQTILWHGHKQLHKPEQP